MVENNKRVNLTAITQADDIINKHFIDSLLFFTAENPPEGASLIDVGTGAGFPGLPLLIVREDLKLTFLDSTQKKLRHIEEVLKETGLQARIIHARAEEAGQDGNLREKFDYVTARAVAGLNLLAEYCLPLVKPGGKFVALKARGMEEELSNAQEAVKTLGGAKQFIKTHDIDGLGERKLLVLKKIRPSPPQYPRPMAQIKKRPL